MTGGERRVVNPAAAVHENLYALFRAIATLPGAELDEGPVVSRHDAPLPNPIFHGVWRSRPDEAGVDALIDDTIAWFRARRAAAFFWWTSPDDPPHVARRLQARGFNEHVRADVGMAARIDALKADPDHPDGLEIACAQAPRELDDWRDVFSAAYGVPASAGQSWVDATRTLGGRAPWRLFVGYLHGRPVATNLSFDGAGARGLYAIATLPAYRGRGVGSAITLAPLRRRAETAPECSVLFASPMGRPVYERLGFRDVNRPIGRYLWKEGSGLQAPLRTSKF